MTLGIIAEKVYSLSKPSAVSGRKKRKEAPFHARKNLLSGEDQDGRWRAPATPYPCGCCGRESQGVRTAYADERVKISRRIGRGRVDRIAARAETSGRSGIENRGLAGGELL